MEEEPIKKAKCDIEIRCLGPGRFVVVNYITETGGLEKIKSKNALVRLILSFTKEGKRVCLIPLVEECIEPEKKE